ncbi:hypothetical protein [Pseudomonas sp. 1152_12]|uniref:hypothetical protein n=1 Tax=Pseudomonas sp. 1152_12 TaxID=2604455 RepID=UPI00406290AE
MSVKQDTHLQGAYISETLADGSYFTVIISLADYDAGTIKGKWGMNAGPANDLGKSGYHRLDQGTESSINLDFGTMNCVLLAPDHSYTRLAGVLHFKNTNTVSDIVFKKAK